MGGLVRALVRGIVGFELGGIVGALAGALVRGAIAFEVGGRVGALVGGVVGLQLGAGVRDLVGALVGAGPIGGTLITLNVHNNPSYGEGSVGRTA